MKILVACEESQAVTIELRRLGHEAYSCDIIPCSGGHPEWHLQVDALELLKLMGESSGYGRCRQAQIEPKTARRHFTALQKPWQSNGPETYGRNEMRWSTKAPKKAGWYLVTLKDGIVMPAYRSEYPTGNFTWKELPHGSVVIASIRFPKAYKED